MEMNIRTIMVMMDRKDTAKDPKSTISIMATGMGGGTTDEMTCGETKSSPELLQLHVSSTFPRTLYCSVETHLDA